MIYGAVAGKNSVHPEFGKDLAALWSGWTIKNWPPDLVMVKKDMGRILFCVLQIVVFSDLALSAIPATYYISSTTGADNNSGLTPTQAWKNVSKIYSKALAEGFGPGDQILLKKGDTWHGQIYFDGGRGAGTKENPITISSYGQGEDPILIGDSSEFVWSAVKDHPGVFRADLGEGSNVIFTFLGEGKIKAFSGKKGLGSDKKVLRDFVDALTPDSFGPRGGVSSEVFVRTKSGLAPKYPEFSFFRGPLVRVRQGRHLVIRGLALRKSSVGVDVEDSNDVVISDNKIEDILSMGIYLRNSNRHITVKDNKLSRLGNDGVYVLKSNDNLVQGNTISEVGSPVMGFRTRGDQNAIGLQESKNNIVERNMIIKNRGGIDYYFEEGSVVRYNYIEQTKGFASPHGTNLSVHHNIFHQNLPVPGGGVSVNNTGSGKIFVYNNLFFGKIIFGLLDQTVEGKGPVIFRNNIIYTTGPGAFVKVTEKTDSDFNCFYSAEKVLPRFKFGKNIHPDLATAQRTGNQDLHSVFSDPQFVSPMPKNPEQFRLKATSPCLHSGTSQIGDDVKVSADSHKDFAGAALGKGRKPAMGPFEEQ